MRPDESDRRRYRRTLDRLRGELLDARITDARRDDDRHSSRDDDRHSSHDRGPDGVEPTIRHRSGHWSGRLSSSALATATALSATLADPAPVDGAVEIDIPAAIEFLSRSQNADGGFGDTDRSKSNIATTYLVLAADAIVRRHGHAGLHADGILAANHYVDRGGRIQGLRQRYGKDKTFVVPIMTNLAIAGLIHWDAVPALPFELAALPRSFYAAVGMPVVSYALPALIAIGIVRHEHAPSHHPITRWLRHRVRHRVLDQLGRMQPASGGYLEATPLTAFVAMSLRSSGHGGEVLDRCQQFLNQSQRSHGGWPIDTNLATWVTSLAIEALDADPLDDRRWNTPRLRDWHRRCQTRDRHSMTGARPGGWGWTDLSGSVPDGDDTPAAILATEIMDRGVATQTDTDTIGPPATASGSSIARAKDWLAELQNRDGGVPTFCRGWGKLPFDRSSVDLTAHALRSGGIRVDRAVKFLTRQQHDDGSFHPLWFGNQDREDESNPVYGTSRVLAAAEQLPVEMVDRAAGWLVSAANADGGWGGGESVGRLYGIAGRCSSVEETALGLEALIAAWRSRRPSGSPSNSRSGGPRRPTDDELNWAILRAAERLCDLVDADCHRWATPIGFYFAKLWYYEDLYPVLFSVRALGHLQRYIEGAEPATDTV